MDKKIVMVWALVFLAMVGYLIFISGDLPDRLAVHFDINGNPNGFQNKTAFNYEFFWAALFINSMFLVAYWCIDRLSPENINIPWKKYWFSTEERKIVAFEKLRAVMGLTGIFVCTTLLFTEQVIYQANTKNPFFEFPINAGVMVMGALAVFFIVLVVVITKPPTED